MVGWVPVRTFFRVADGYFCLASSLSRKRERERESSSGVFSYKGTNSIHEGGALMT